MTFDDWKNTCTSDMISAAEAFSRVQNAGSGALKIDWNKVAQPTDELAQAILARTSGLTDFKALGKRWLGLTFETAKLILPKDPGYLGIITFCFQPYARLLIVDLLMEGNHPHIDTAGMCLRAIGNYDHLRNAVTKILEHRDGGRVIEANAHALDELTNDHADVLVNTGMERFVRGNLARFKSIDAKTVVALIKADTSQAVAILESGVCKLDSNLADHLIGTIGSAFFAQNLIHMFSRLSTTAGCLLYEGGQGDVVKAHLGRFEWTR